MPARLIQSALSSVLVFEQQLLCDARGSFMESFRSDQCLHPDWPRHIVQENHSRSRRGVLRGLHFQWDPPMAKLMRVTLGCAFLVAVDIRPGSLTLGQWHGSVG